MLLWNNNQLRITAFLLAALALRGALFAGELPTHSPQLLLTPQRLRRLQRDRERQTIRWANFDARVQSVPDSPERGFELALYYAVTRDEKRGREAVAWALAHPCEQRQAALVLDWCSDLISEGERSKLSGSACPTGNTTDASSARDALFMSIAEGKDVDPLLAAGRKTFLPALQAGGFTDSRKLYAAAEFLLVARSTQHVDLRQGDPRFFSTLPTEFLLSLKPRRVEHPDWMTHIAALALVGLDPNLEGSQYLQAWAIEERQMLHDGPGVAYEYLWADPYLPGVGYQNLDPWVYDANGRLFARSDWNTNACWIEISTGGVEEENCPPGWRERAVVFGRVTLVPAAQPCTPLPRRQLNETAVLWKLRPDQALYYLSEQQVESTRADAAGMWRAPNNVEGNICTSPDKLKVPKAHTPTRN